MEQTGCQHESGVFGSPLSRCLVQKWSPLVVLHLEGHFRRVLADLDVYLQMQQPVSCQLIHGRLL